MIPESVKEKAIKALDAWAVMFKLIGTPSETPRYAQLMTNEDGKFTLHSTQKNLYYDLDLTEEEQEELLWMDSDKRWAEWRNIRTAHLIKNHPTIHPY